MADWHIVRIEQALPILRRYARALTRDEASSDDLVQEALVRAIERADTFERTRSLKTWLLAIVHNQFVTGLRREQAEARRDAAFALSQVERDPQVDQETMLYLRQVGELFDSLPDHQRAVLHLVAVEGLTYQETADTLGIAVGTVMSRLSRARATLRAAAEGPGDYSGLHVVGGTDAS